MKRSNRQLATIVLMLLGALATGGLAAFSFAKGQLYSPFGTIAEEGAGAGYYFGIAIYITLAATLLTSAAIRIALRLSR